MSQSARFGQRSVAEQVMARLTTIYGSQKMAAMWVSTEKPEARAEMMATWNQALSPYPLPAIQAALDGYLQDGSSWPPTLSEMVKEIKDEVERQSRSEAGKRSMLRLPAPSDLAPPDSPAVEEFRKELSRFLGKHKVSA